MFKPKLPQQEQGFTLVEVLVAILITTLFVSVAMQSMVIAAVFKARAQEFSEATSWIQEGLEDVNYKAATFQYTSLTANAASGASSINVASVDDFVVNDKLKVGSDSGTYTISGISGTTLTISPSLGTAQSQGVVVAGITRCKNSMLTADAASGTSSINVAVVDSFSSGDTVKVGSDSGTYTISGISGTTLTVSPSLGTAQSQSAVVVGTPNLGFADGLQDKVTGSNLTVNSNSVSITKTSNRTGKAFNMVRTTTLSSAVPYNVLQVRYSVTPTSGGSSVAGLSTEVIPNAAFQCP
jgi:prepilin-type N-terminal cleavage/methylation domain-containing protein